MNYHKNLAQEGIQKDRALEIAISLHSLYESLNRLDSANMAIFCSKPIEKRLTEYALAEGGMRDVMATSQKTSETESQGKDTEKQHGQPV